MLMLRVIAGFLEEYPRDTVPRTFFLLTHKGGPWSVAGVSVPIV